MCSDAAMLSSSGPGDLFELSERSNTTPFYLISPTTITTGVHLGFERDFNYHTAFQGVLCHYA